MALNQIPVRTINATDTVPTINSAPQANTTGNITAVGSVVTALDLTGVGSAIVAIKGTHAGINLIFEASPDNGATYYPVNGENTSTRAQTSAGQTGAITTNASVAWSVTPLTGFDRLQVRATAWTSGTGAITIHPSAQFTQLSLATQPISGTTTSVGTAAVDAALSGNPVLTAGRASLAVPTAMSADNDVQTPWLDRVGRFMVAQKAAASSLTSVAAATASTTVLAANTGRIGATITNESSAVMTVGLASATSATSYTVQLSGQSAAPYSYYEVPAGYTGVITAIWASATGNARITEIS